MLLLRHGRIKLCANFAAVRGYIPIRCATTAMLASFKLLGQPHQSEMFVKSQDEVLGGVVQTPGPLAPALLISE